MGYYSYYQLNADNYEKHEEMWNWAEKNIPEIKWAVDDLEGGVNQSTKWYDHEKDLIELSIMFPEVTFKLHGEGEESGDIWDKVFKGGRLISSIHMEERIVLGEKSTKLLEEAYEALKDILNAADNGQPYDAVELRNEFNPTINKLYNHIEKVKGVLQ